MGRLRLPSVLLGVSTTAVLALATALPAADAAAATAYDLNTLAGKVASVNATAPPFVRFSGYLQEEADADLDTSSASAPITPPFVLSSPLDGTSLASPEVTGNQDVNGAPQNETAIAVDPTNPSRMVAAANDYVTRTWSCTLSDGSPCSAHGDGYSGTYFSNDGGETWCCAATDPAHIGTLIPGVEHLVGGAYDAGGDPALAFDSRGNVFYAGLGFNRTSAPNTVTLSRGTFDAAGNLSWGAPTFINPTDSPAILNDKEWVGADSHPASPFRDRVYVSWTRFVFNPATGAYVQSPIKFAFSTDGGATFSSPQAISGKYIFDQGSNVEVAPDGTVYVFFEGAAPGDTLSSTVVVKSTDGGDNWSKPVVVSQVHDINLLQNTRFRNNSFPAAAVAPDGTVYATWATQRGNAATTVWSRSTDGGATWSAFAPAFAPATQVAAGYPVTQPDGSVLNAPATAGPVENVFPAIAVSPSGRVYIGSYASDVVSPWQTCAKAPRPPRGRIECDQLGNYIHNARLDYVVTDLTTHRTQTVSTHPINTRNGFGGGFFGDYTDLAVGSDDVFHAFFTDTNNRQTVTWFYGFQFTPTPINQEDVATARGSF